MLDIQRFRKDTLRQEVHFTRLVIWTHLGLGGVVVLCLLFHELFYWAAGASLWYMISMLFVAGIMAANISCRWALAGAFLLFCGSGIYFLGQVHPQLHPDSPPLLPLALLPFWLGVLNVAYFVGAGLMVGNPSIKKANQIGFKLL